MPTPPTLHELTARQREVLLMKANGSTSIEIAVFLGVKKWTVDEIVQRACRCLGADNVTQAVAIALAIGELGIHQVFVPAEQQEAA
jgi:LuxR family transcriptional regulator of spore coat protein